MRSTHYERGSFDDGGIGSFSVFEVCVMLFLFFFIRPLIWFCEKVAMPIGRAILNVGALLFMFGYLFWGAMVDTYGPLPGFSQAEREERRLDRQRSREGRMTPDGR